MKLHHIALCAFFLFSCNVRGNGKICLSENNNCKQNDSSNVYKIIRIDSTDNIYIIWAQKNQLIYKIISFKDSLKCMNTVKLGQSYCLKLKSVFPDNSLQKDRIHFVRYGTVNVPLGGEGVVWDLFSVQNLKGLCLFYSPQ